MGATVEFPPDSNLANSLTLQPEAERLQAVLEGAIAYCPALAQGEITERWFGLRPRPQGQAAPVIQPLLGYSNIWLATGHYRNGVLLAPATALAMVEHLT
ncbi:MAG: FAD-binding oxidoreductase [Leptolyngbyaceae cyanobacterium SM2_3_12]|nr:FAD-binding oxidoreductase [Leptolyngbyaceae cyanobacterium SM2_3_12]